MLSAHNLARIGVDAARGAVDQQVRVHTGFSGPACAIDDETAIEVVQGTVRIVSEGQWKHFPS